MDEKSFCYWLKGHIEMNPDTMLTEVQWKILKDHLELVFKKETPYRFPTINPSINWPQPATMPLVGTPQLTC